MTPGRLIAYCMLFFERKDERTMKHFWKRFVVCSLCLATLLLAFGTPLTSYAARTVLQLPSDDPPSATCVPTDPLNRGISYDATEYFGFVLTDEPWEQALGAFGYGGSPFVAAWTCGVNTIILGSDAEGGWTNVATTVNGVTTMTTPTFTSVDRIWNEDLHEEIALSVQPHQHYTFQVQNCWIGSLGLSTCTVWSPHLEILTAANSSCQNGYVWRQADFNGIDHVCVQPWEAVQATYDNNHQSGRVDTTSSSWPRPCLSGYVWREAWGGDYVCVDPPQRQQVYDDNSEAINRIVAL